MPNRSNVLLALGVFLAVFCVTFWRDALFQPVGAAMENAPPEARTYSTVTTTTDVQFQRAKAQVVEMGPNGEIHRSQPSISAPSPKTSRVATLVVDGRNRLCHIATGPNGTERWIVDYDDSHFSEREGLKFTWPASGCDAALEARGEVMTYAQAVRRRAAVVPHTEAFAQERVMKANHVWHLEHDGGAPPDNLPLL
jgi:hypothetical protein